MSNAELIAELASLLSIDAGNIALEPCHSGGNNRVFIVKAGDRKWVAKWYFRHASDPRDRLGAEYAFLSYAKKLGIDCVPAPLARDDARGIGVYEYVEGSKLQGKEIAAAEIDAAAGFFLRLNPAEMRAQASGLPDASEACFSVAGHCTLVDQRVARLGAIPGTSEVDGAAREFAAALAARWQRTKAAILSEVRRAGADPDAALAERCVSPSDFGFHNALFSPARGICFIDFEYAGWDDPAKMVGDFFSHPGVPVDMAYFERFLATVVRYAERPDDLVWRTRLLFPLFRVKWCCIILNDFVPDAARRRRFADPAFDEDGRKRAQLDKAQRLLDLVETAQ